jgi:hypothetical protein
MSGRRQHDPFRSLALAFAVSAVAHALLSLGLPRYHSGFTPTVPTRYDASLAPMRATPGTSLSTAAGAAKKASPRTALPVRASANVATTPSAADEAAPSAAPTEALTEATTNTASATLPATEAAFSPPRPSASAEEPTPAAPPHLPPTPAPTPVPPTRVAPVFAERIAIEYRLSMSLSDGVATYRWVRQGTRYEIDSSIQPTGFIVGTFAGVLHQQSAGEITEDGLRPERFSIRRGEAEAETADFQRETATLQMTRRREVRKVPLTDGMQDMQSFLFQLAYDAPRLTAEGDRLDVLVTNARKVYRYQFKRLGVETVETRFGPVETIRLLSEAANPEDAYEVWLAPQYNYLPVRLRYYLGRFPVEQIAVRIGVSSPPDTPSSRPR